MSATFTKPRASLRPELLLLLAVAVAAPCYALVLNNGSFDLVAAASALSRRGRADLNFNSMLDHMLRGGFDVDPAIVGEEGFAHGGKVYTYFGPFLGLLRLPLVPFGGLMAWDVTPLSCLAAICLGLYMKLRAALAVRRAVPASRLSRTVFAALALSFLLGGPQIQLLRTSMFQEAVLWASALSATFVFLAVRALVREPGFDGGALASMAFVAGLALLTRVTAGIGLYAALSFCMLVLARPGVRSGWRGGLRRAWPPVLILALFALACAFVNYERWGSPFVFAPFSQQILNVHWPARALVEARYGDLNPIRIPFGLQYYFVPVWAIWTNGALTFAGFQDRAMMMVELPPSSMLLTDPLLFLLAAWAVAEWRRAGAAVPRGPAAAIALGLAAQAVLILMASAMAFRYRSEFYPLLEFLAFLGFYGRAARGGELGLRQARVIWGLMAVGIVASFLSLGLYRLSPFGPASAVLDTDPVTYYRDRLGWASGRVGHGPQR